MAGILNKCGAFGGRLIGPNPFNKKGFFENGLIRQKVVKPYLSSIGADVMGQNPLPDVENLRPFPELRSVLERIMKEQGYCDGDWFYKGAKICLLWPLWAEAFPNARWVIVRRPDKDIVDSCLRTPFMFSFRDREGWQNWIDEHKKRFNEIKESEVCNEVEVWSNRIVKGDLLEIKKVVASLELKWNDDVKKIIDPKIYHYGD